MQEKDTITLWEQLLSMTEDFEMRRAILPGFLKSLSLSELIFLFKKHYKEAYVGYWIHNKIIALDSEKKTEKELIEFEELANILIVNLDEAPHEKSRNTPKYLLSIYEYLSRKMKNKVYKSLLYDKRKLSKRYCLKICDRKMIDKYFDTILNVCQKDHTLSKYFILTLSKTYDSAFFDKHLEKLLSCQLEEYSLRVIFKMKSTLTNEDYNYIYSYSPITFLYMKAIHAQKIEHEVFDSILSKISLDNFHFALWCLSAMQQIELVQKLLMTYNDKVRERRDYYQNI